MSVLVLVLVLVSTPPPFGAQSKHWTPRPWSHRLGYSSPPPLEALARASPFAPDYNTWVDKPEVIQKVKDNLRDYQSKDAASSVLDSASSLFSWLFSPNILADVYFCPERHAM